MSIWRSCRIAYFFAPESFISPSHVHSEFSHFFYISRNETKAKKKKEVELFWNLQSSLVLLLAESFISERENLALAGKER